MCRGLNSLFTGYLIYFKAFNKSDKILKLIKKSMKNRENINIYIKYKMNFSKYIAQ